jgi:hypothetical protein
MRIVGRDMIVNEIALVQMLRLVDRALAAIELAYACLRHRDRFLFLCRCFSCFCCSLANRLTSPAHLHVLKHNHFASSRYTLGILIPWQTFAPIQPHRLHRAIASRLRIETKMQYTGEQYPLLGGFDGNKLIEHSGVGVTALPSLRQRNS